MFAPGEAAEPHATVRRGPILIALTKVFLGVVAGLAGFDLAYGWYDAKRDLSDSGLLVFDDHLSWTNRPGFENPETRTRINSLGLRSPEIGPDAPADEVRVLGVGASRCYGAGVNGPDMDQTWSFALEAIAAKSFPGHWRVLNGGVLGYSGVQMARRATKLIPEVEPDLLVLFLSPGSQMLMDPSAARNWVRFGEHDLLVPADIVRAWPAPLVPTAAALHGLLQRSHLYRRYRAQSQDNGQRDADIDKFVLSRAPRNERVESMYQRTLEEMVALRDIARESGVELRLVLLLEPFQDDDARWQAYLAKHAAQGAPPIGTPRGESIEAMQEAFGKLGMKTWSFQEEVDIVGRDRERYTCDGAHWSPEGHALFARGIARRMQEEGLIDQLLASRRARPRP